MTSSPLQESHQAFSPSLVVEDPNQNRESFVMTSPSLFRLPEDYCSSMERLLEEERMGDTGIVKREGKRRILFDNTSDVHDGIFTDPLIAASAHTLEDLDMEKYIKFDDDDDDDGDDDDGDQASQANQDNQDKINVKGTLDGLMVEESLTFGRDKSLHDTTTIPTAQTPIQENDEIFAEYERIMLMEQDELMEDLDGGLEDTMEEMMPIVKIEKGLVVAPSETTHQDDLKRRPDQPDSEDVISKKAKLFAPPPKYMNKGFGGFSDIPLDGEYFSCKRQDGGLAFFPRRQKSIDTSDYEMTNMNGGERRILGLIRDIEDQLYYKRKGKGNDADENSASVVNNESRLWVDKYAPKTFTDLLSVDSVNVQVLEWIAAWKHCVFGSSRNQQHLLKEKKKLIDPLSRPDKRILLLCGPPGLGKTTLAHVVAKTAGYSTIEINASDERTGDGVISKLDAALNSKYDVKNCLDKKPILAIIDEIDGAASGSGEKSLIRYLVNLATVTKKVDSKKKVKKASLKRPIICICNDPYVPALKTLREVALIIPVHRPSMSRISRRLKDICSFEKFQVDMRALGSLIEMTDGDIRSCLHVLQFHARKRKTLDHETLLKSASSIGQKDVNKGNYSLLLEILQAPNWRKGESSSMNTNYLHKLSKLIGTHGEYEKLLQGCFENYLTIKYHDDHMTKVVETGDWMLMYEQINNHIYGSGGSNTGGISNYLCLPIINFHRFFAGSIKQYVKFPKYDYQMYLESSKNSDTLKNFFDQLPGSTQSLASKSVFRRDCISKIHSLTEPNIKSVNPQVIKGHEQVLLQKTINLLEAFGLNFVQSKNADGEYEYCLKPALGELLMTLPGDEIIPSSFVRSKNYSIKQYISQTINSRKLGSRSESKPATSRSYRNYSDHMDIESVAISSSSISNTPSAKPLPPPAPPKKTAVRDLGAFFNRRVIPKAAVVSNAKSSDSGGIMAQALAMGKPRFWIRFNEGHSNAVRRPLKIRDLLSK